MTFDHLKKLEVPGDRLAWLDLPEICPGARIQGRPATEANPPYFEALVARSSARVRSVARGVPVRVRHVQQARDEDRELFPLYVLTTFENFQDVDGNVLACTPELLAEFCEKCPGDIFDRIRNFFASIEVFRDEQLPEPRELAENSGAGSSGS